MKIAFRIDLEPKPSNQRHAVIRCGHARVVQDPGVVNHQAAIALLSAQYAPPQPFAGPVCVEIVCVLPRPKSLPKKLGVERLPHATRPDADNLSKSVTDGLGQSGRWFRDDGQVQRLVVEKWVAAEGEAPHYQVEVSDG